MFLGYGGLWSALTGLASGAAGAAWREHRDCNRAAAQKPVLRTMRPTKRREWSTSTARTPRCRTTTINSTASVIARVSGTTASMSPTGTMTLRASSPTTCIAQPRQL